MSLQDEVKKVIRQYKSEILTIPNVLGVGIGYRITAGRMTGELSIMLLVRRKLPVAGLSAKALAPSQIEGIRTDVLEVGDIRPLMLRTDRWRPAPGGVSIGHYKISAGTLGCVVRDRETGDRLILSNNHVLANINDAGPGDPILQPGAADGGQVQQDTIARLERFCPIDFGSEPPDCNVATGFVSLVNLFAGAVGSSHKVDAYQQHPAAMNMVDAAVARPVNDADISDEIIDIGTLEGTMPAQLGMTVRKSGRTSELSSGEVTVLDATVTVSYGSGLEAVFEDQIVTTALSRGGDSGSMLVAGDSNYALGLLFAGSDVSTIHNPIQNVLDCLEVDLPGSPGDNLSSKQARINRAQAVKEAYQGMLMSKPNVVGVGVGLRDTAGRRTDEVALVVIVSEKVPVAQLAAEDVIPTEIEGVPVDVKEVGKIEAQ